jgi:hypothetical protein
MDIDFAVDVPDERTGLAFLSLVEPMGFRARVSRDEVTGDWTCYCSRTMVPAYEAMMQTQRLLEEVGKPFGARPDGWGSFGNGPN